jgi:hypothetical protein
LVLDRAQAREGRLDRGLHLGPVSLEDGARLLDLLRAEPELGQGRRQHRATVRLPRVP